MDGFVKNFNNFRKAVFIPGDYICAENSRWRSIGEEWINIGVLIYVDIYRMLDNECGIQDTFCEIEKYDQTQASQDRYWRGCI